MKVLIRTDASSHIGSGHVMRCITLAKRLLQDGAVSTFVCREHDGHLIDLIERNGFAVSRLPRPKTGAGLEDYAAWLGASQAEDAAQTQMAMNALRADWIVVDHYGLDAEWEALMRPYTTSILVLDDLANRRHDCDVLLDQNLVAGFEHRYDHLLESKATRLLGPQYALLQPEYAALAVSVTAASEIEPRVLIFMGNADRGTTLKAVQGLMALNRQNLACDIVMANTNPDFAQVESLVASYPNITIHGPLPSLAPLMARASLAVGAGGATSWERLCMGLHAVVVILAENQRAITEELERRELVTVAGDAASVTAEDFCRAIDRTFTSGTLRLRPNIVDGRGTERVAAVLTAGPGTCPILRTANASDEDLLLSWANDKLVRANAFNSRSITPDEHQKWFAARLASPDHCRFLIAETKDGVPLGQVRLERLSAGWLINYSIAPQFRGRGLGKLILQAAITQLNPGDTVIGEVLPSNLASHKIFIALGFSGSPGPQGATRYELHL